GGWSTSTGAFDRALVERGQARAQLQSLIAFNTQNRTSPNRNSHRFSVSRLFRLPRLLSCHALVEGIRSVAAERPDVHVIGSAQGKARWRITRRTTFRSACWLSGARATPRQRANYFSAMPSASPPWHAAGLRPGWDGASIPRM